MIKKFEKKDDLFRFCSKKLKEYIIDILTEKNKVTIGLPGGRSILPILNYLSKEEIPWEKIHVFMVDERLVSLESKESNFRLVKKGLVDVLHKENFHPFLFDANKKDFGMKRYEEEIKKYNSKFDIFIVSSGEDGHIAALYPNHHSIKDESDYLITMNDSPKPPAERITFSKNFLLNSSYSILLFVGEAKKTAFNNFLNDSLSLYDCPAKLIKSIQNHSVFVYEK